MYDMIEQFKKFEEEKGLLTDRVADFYYWVYVRFNVYMKLEEIANRQVKLTVKKNHIQIQDLFFLIRNLTYNNPLLYHEHRDILFLRMREELLITENMFAYILTRLQNSLRKQRFRLSFFMELNI